MFQWRYRDLGLTSVGRSFNLSEPQFPDFERGINHHPVRTVVRIK